VILLLGVTPEEDDMAAKIGTWDELMADTAEAMRPVASRLRDIVREVDPQTTEVVRLGDRASSFQVGPQKMKHGYVYVLPYSKHVNLGFYKGALLDDPTGVLQGTGAKMRHVKVRSVDEANDPALRMLIAAALAERREALGL